ncbi:Fe-S cluster assembly protein SufD [soil metagenome]
MTQVAEKLHPWVSAAPPVAGPRWLQALRERGTARFSALGFPTVRDEEWRFTNVSPISNGDFRPASPSPVTLDRLAQFIYGDAAHRLVVVNGRFSPELSRLDGLPQTVRAGSLAGVLHGGQQEDSDLAQEHLGALADVDDRAFAALNTAHLDDGAYVFIADGAVVEDPLQILFVSSPDAGSEATVSHPRLLVVAGENSQARMVETYVGTGGSYFTNGVTEVVVGEGAVLDHYKVQQESLAAFHIASMHVRAARSSTFSSHSFSLGGKLVRNDAIATLDGQGAEVTLNGLYLADGERLVDNHTTIDHAQPHCPSHEIYKGILGGTARAVFNGKIIVRQDAQKTDAKQTNRALLLTDGALINTKPQLEIFADDVKCTHGAAIGQLDEDALFYLRARGLTQAEARDMLIHAFAGEIIHRVKVEPLRLAIETELYAQLARDLAEIDAA